jgi:hypothetical protein
MTNRYKPHVLVLPEDDANSQLANGFLLDLDQSVLGTIQILPVAGGWNAVLEIFNRDHVAGMERYAERRMVLLIDFDGQQERMSQARDRIPECLRDRVFILGAWKEPEDLKTGGLGSYEAIGRAMAHDCRERTEAIWGHKDLKHNRPEMERLRQCVRPILFP